MMALRGNEFHILLIIQKILLIINGYGSHMIIPFYNLATETKIILFRLPLHSTHITQFLDVGVIRSFKNYYTDVGDEKFGKLESHFSIMKITNSNFQTKHTP